MRRVSWLAVGCVLGLAVCWAAPARSDEEKVPLDKLPKPVLDGFKKRFPRAEITGASKETEDGKTTFELSFKDNGKNVDVTLTADGTLVLIEKEIDAKALPEAVAKGITAKYPGSTCKRAEEVIKVKDGQEKLDYYEVVIQTADKKKFEVEVAADGTIKKEEAKKDKD